jgi:hypothetical protein
MIMQNAKWIYYYYFLVIFITEKAAGSKDLCVRRGAHFKTSSIVSTKCARLSTYEGGCVGMIRLYWGGAVVLHKIST